MPEVAFGERYSFRVLNPRTFALVAEIAPEDVVAATWTRMMYEPGPWALTIPAVRVAALDAAHGVSVLARQNLIEIRRASEVDETTGLRTMDVEYVGCILERELSPDGQTWRFSGFDLLDWLRRRVVGSTTAVAKSGAAETVIKAYVEENLGATAGAGRVATDELAGGKTFTIEGDLARGATVEYSAQRSTLDRVTADLCRQGGLLQSISIVAGGLKYSVREPTDRTTSSPTPATIFSVNLDNASGIGWREGYRSVINAMVVMGAGTGDTRTVRTVTDAMSISTDFRREGTYEAKAATTNDQLDAIGAAEIERQLSAAVAAEVIPITSSPNARYRVDWDMGDDVTVAIPVAGVTAIDRRIASVTVRLDQQGERITFTLGNERPTSTLRRLQRVIERLRDQGAV